MSADPSGPISRRTLLASLAALAGAACTKAEFLAVNLPAAFGDYRRQTNLAYGPGTAHRLDVYIPNRGRTRPPPLIVFWHGGRWSFGDKADYRFVGAALTELGCVAVLPNYRHYPEVLMPGFMDDAARAAVWARAHAAEFGADPQRFYLMGHSSGAHMAALLALDTRYLRAFGESTAPIAGVVGLSGPYDFLPLLENDLQEMFGPPTLYPQSQPIDYVHAGVPPMLLVHGIRDEVVAPKNSRNLATALAAQGVSTTLRLYHKLGHADTVAALSKPVRARAPTFADIAAFLDSAPRPQAALAVASAVIA